jgi:hypothetical protein
MMFFDFLRVHQDVEASIKTFQGLADFRILVFGTVYSE